MNNRYISALVAPNLALECFLRISAKYSSSSSLKAEFSSVRTVRRVVLGRRFCDGAMTWPRGFVRPPRAVAGSGHPPTTHMRKKAGGQSITPARQWPWHDGLLLSRTPVCGDPRPRPGQIAAYAHPCEGPAGEVVHHVVQSSWSVVEPQYRGRDHRAGERRAPH